MPDVATPQSWARDLADKIRAHDAANIDETEERRSVDLAALVRKSMSAVPPSLKAAYLDELDTHFPVTGAAQPALPAAAKPENESAATVIRRRLPELTDSERGELLRQLLNDAFRETHSSGRLGRLLLEAPRKLNVPATTPPPLDPERLLRTLELFCEVILGLQRLAIELWREVGARKLSGVPVLASEADLRALIARCLAGDLDVPPAMIEQEIERQRRAIAAAMAMLGPFADNYAQAILKRVAPEAIVAQTAGESFSMFGSREAGYWKQFCRTWESLGHEQFEAVFLECLSKQLRTLNR
jgi:hypothetical protein